MMDSPPPAPPPTECELLGGFSLLTQATLAIICIGVLLFKRARERPQRPWIVWLFDVSKQAFSSTLQHAVNVVIGLLLLSGVLLLALRGHVDREHAERIELLSWYWHFVDVVWIAVFTVVYVIGV